MEQKCKCPCCGGEEMVEGMQNGYGEVGPADRKITFRSQVLYHTICLKCGTVVRSYVKDPKKLL